MVNDNHSLLLLDILDTFEIRSHRVRLERVHPFEELNEKNFRKLFDFLDVYGICPRNRCHETYFSQ